jgi:uncharacterized protein (TIGR03083 family)
MPDMVDTSDLNGLDPYDLLDAEAARIDAYLSSLPTGEWARPSRCAGWSVRDVAAHLAATETYHHACLDGRARELFEAMAARGVSGLSEANELGVRDRDGVPNDEVVAEWRTADADTRHRMRGRDGGDMDSSVGPYPVRLQAFHVASELAIHADDMHVPITAEEAGARWAWRARFSRFAVKESGGDVAVGPQDGSTTVRVNGVDHTLDDAVFVEAVAGRPVPDGAVADEVAAALSLTP